MEVTGVIEVMGVTGGDGRDGGMEVMRVDGGDGGAHACMALSLTQSPSPRGRMSGSSHGHRSPVDVWRRVRLHLLTT